ncbi:MAG: 50S ribosomal protein L15e [Nanoarchaeota archaeon]
MGYLKYVRAAWKNPKKNLGDIWKERLMTMRREPVTVRIDRPTRIDRARSLGYKAKEGYIVIRQRVTRGGKQRPDIKGGRRSAHSGQRLALRKNYQQLCEGRAAKKYPNCEVLNSYWVAEDGMRIWYEIIMVDRSHPAVKKDPRIAWISGKVDRPNRGLTSAGRKSRSLRGKGKGYEKVRPSRGANKRLH